MATNEQVRQMITARPFQPSTVKTADGRTFTVRHPENIGRSINGRGMTIEDENGSHPLEMLLVELIELVAAPAAESRAEGNGG
jgi:hypothetical protein